jgi:RHS repeat-associated protein
VSRNGWDTLPTNHDLNVEEIYQLCTGTSCPHLPVRGGTNVTLLAQRTFNLLGAPKSIVYPSADSTLEGWIPNGSTITIDHNALGEPKKVTFKLAADGVARELARHSAFNVVGAPKAGTVSVYGYHSNRPGQFQVVAATNGQAGVAVTAHTSIGRTWDYDDRGRLESYAATRGAETLYGVSAIGYTDDSLIESWTRSDIGLAASYSAGYDERGQLKTYRIDGGIVIYGIDGDGNLLDRSGMLTISVPRFTYANGTEVNLPDGAISLLPGTFGPFDAANRSTNPSLAYDAEGRLTQDGGRSFAYSRASQVETITRPDGRIEQQMLYDGEGNLARLVQGGQAHYYLRDEGGRLLYEEVHDAWFYGSQFRDANGDVVPDSRRYEYVYLGDSHIATIEHAAGVSSIAYHVRDWRDFEAVSLDADDAFARIYSEAAPYGQEIRTRSDTFATNGSALRSPYLQELHAADYLNNRWRTLDAWRGRFGTPDPARVRHERLPQGANLYANNFNNPFRYVDEDGRHPLVYALIFALGMGAAVESDQQANLVEVFLASTLFTRTAVGMGAPHVGKVVAEATAKEAATAGFRVGKTLVETVGKEAAPVVQRVLKGKEPLSALSAETRQAAAAFYRDVATRTSGKYAQEAAKYNIARAEFLEGPRATLPPTLPKFIETLAR